MSTLTDVSNSVRATMPRHAALDDAVSAVNSMVTFICAVIVALVKLVVPHIFTLGGLAAFVYAAFLYGLVPGFVVLGLAFFVFETRITRYKS